MKNINEIITIANRIQQERAVLEPWLIRIDSLRKLEEELAALVGQKRHRSPKFDTSGILACLSASGTPLRISDIAKKTSLPYYTVCGYLGTQVRLGAIRRVGIGLYTAAQALEAIQA